MDVSRTLLAAPDARALLVTMTRTSQLRTGVLALFLAAGSLTCDDVTPPDGAGAIEIAERQQPDGSRGPGTARTHSSCLVTDDAGDPLAGVSVSWSAQGGGSVRPRRSRPAPTDLPP